MSQNSEQYKGVGQDGPEHDAACQYDRDHGSYKDNVADSRIQPGSDKPAASPEMPPFTTTGGK